MQELNHTPSGLGVVEERRAQPGAARDVGTGLVACSEGGSQDTGERLGVHAGGTAKHVNRGEAVFGPGVDGDVGGRDLGDATGPCGENRWVETARTEAPMPAASARTAASISA